MICLIPELATNCGPFCKRIYKHSNLPLRVPSKCRPSQSVCYIPSLSLSLTLHITFPNIASGLANRDILACAPTGSGKTLAFSIPILHHLKAPQKGGFRAVIVSPTRELAQQIHRQFEVLCKGKPFKICVLTAVSNTGDDTALGKFKNFDILITTPLRLVTAIKTNSIKLDLVQHIVFDEADKLLDEGSLFLALLTP